MNHYELNNSNIEDIEDLLGKVEASFEIKFASNELININTFGELCDHIVNKIQLENFVDCTSQQAFYKLRSAFASVLLIDSQGISTNTMLSNLLPRNKRKDSISKLENYIGFKLYILRPPHWITNALIIIFILSLIVIFINWKIGLSSIVFSLLGLWLTNKIGNELDLNTVGDIAKKMTRDNYIKSRRNTKTFNKMEIEKVLTDLFCTDLELDRNKLIRESKFI